MSGKIFDNIPFFGEDLDGSFLWEHRLMNQLWQSMDVVRTEDEVYLVIGLQNRFDDHFFLGHTATDADDEFRVALF